jgi:hypothetical protein
MAGCAGVDINVQSLCQNIFQAHLHVLTLIAYLFICGLFNDAVITSNDRIIKE